MSASILDEIDTMLAEGYLEDEAQTLEEVDATTDEIEELMNAHSAKEPEEQVEVTESATHDGVNDQQASQSIYVIPKKREKAKKPRAPAPTWAKTPVPRSSAPDSIREALSRESMSNLKIRMLSLLCSGMQLGRFVNIGSDISMKVSLQPLPGTRTTVRGSCVTNDAGNVDEVVFDLGGKVVPLTMAIGDIRSTKFRDGAVPCLSVEVPLANGACANGEWYLPALSASPGPRSFPLICNIASCQFTLIAEVIASQTTSSIVQGLTSCTSCSFKVEVLGLLAYEPKMQIKFVDVQLSVKSSSLKVNVSTQAAAFDGGVKFKDATATVDATALDTDVLDILLNGGSLGCVRVPLSLYIRKARIDTPESFACWITSEDVCKVTAWSLVLRLYDSTVYPSDNTKLQLVPTTILPKIDDGMDHASPPLALSPICTDGHPRLSSSASVRTSGNVSTMRKTASAATVQGALHCCIYGIVGPNEMDKSTGYYVDMICKPDDVNATTSTANLVVSSRGSTFAKFEKTSKFQVVYNAQQRNVGFLKFSLYQSTKKIRSSTNDISCGDIALDLCSLLVGSEPQILLTSFGLNFQLLLGFHFVKDEKITLTSIFDLCACYWDDLLTSSSPPADLSPSQLHLLISPDVNCDCPLEEMKIEVSSSVDRFQNIASASLYSSDDDGTILSWAPDLLIPSADSQVVLLRLTQSISGNVVDIGTSTVI